MFEQCALHHLRHVIEQESKNQNSADQNPNSRICISIPLEKTLWGMTSPRVVNYSC